MTRNTGWLLAATLFCAGCVGTSASAPATPKVIDVQLRQDAVERVWRESVLRVRAVGCDGVATGTAFSLGDGRYATNRHVVDGATRIELDTWDGMLYPVNSVLLPDGGADLAVLESEHRTSALGAFRDVEPGVPVSVIGYPGGREWSVREGSVLDVVVGNALDPSQRTLRVSAEVERGNSGGPIVGPSGEIGGILFAGNGPVALAIPANEAARLIDDAKAAPLRPC